MEGSVLSSVWLIFYSSNKYGFIIQGFLLIFESHNFQRDKKCTILYCKLQKGLESLESLPCSFLSLFTSLPQFLHNCSLEGLVLTFSEVRLFSRRVSFRWPICITSHLSFPSHNPCWSWDLHNSQK